MSLDPPPYLAQLQSNIRQRPIPWDGAARAGTITEDQLAKIRAVDKVRTEQRKQIVEDDLEGYTRLFVGEPGTPSVIETASKRSDVIKYILVLLSDLLQGESQSSNGRSALHLPTDGSRPHLRQRWDVNQINTVDGSHGAPRVLLPSA